VVTVQELHDLQGLQNVLQEIWQHGLEEEDGAAGGDHPKRPSVGAGLPLTPDHLLLLRNKPKALRRSLLPSRNKHSASPSDLNATALAATLGSNVPSSLADEAHADPQAQPSKAASHFSDVQQAEGEGWQEARVRSGAAGASHSDAKPIERDGDRRLRHARCLFCRGARGAAAGGGARGRCGGGADEHMRRQMEEMQVRHALLAGWLAGIFLLYGSASVSPRSCAQAALQFWSVRRHSRAHMCRGLVVIGTANLLSCAQLQRYQEHLVERLKEAEAARAAKRRRKKGHASDSEDSSDGSQDSSDEDSSDESGSSEDEEDSDEEDSSDHDGSDDSEESGSGDEESEEGSNSEEGSSEERSSKERSSMEGSERDGASNELLSANAGSREPPVHEEP
jgi:hypothetical protein